MTDAQAGATMLVIWQGYGYIALAVAILPMAACIGLIDFSTKLGLFAAGVGFLVAGLICFGANRSLVRSARRREAEARAERAPENALRAGGVADGETVHTLYFIPLWVWGWIYGIFGAFFAGASLVGIILKGWKN